MPTKIANVASDSYQAYSGPDVGGFSLVQPPDLGVDELTRQFMLGDANTPPHPLVGLYGAVGPSAKARNGGPTKIALASDQATPIDMMKQPLMNETIAPKGGVPRQATLAESEAYRPYDAQNALRQLQEQAIARERAQGRGALANFGISGQKEFSNAMLATPGAVLDIGSYPLRSIISAAQGGGLPPLSVAPKPTVDQIAAYARSKLTGMPYDQAQQNVDLAEGAREAVNPISTTLGKVAGDIGTVLAGRLPIARAVVGETMTPEAMTGVREAVAALPPSATKQFQTVWNSAISKSLRRAGFKAGETGLEGASLAYLHDGDPVKTGLYSSASQLAGSMALGAIRHPAYSAGAVLASALGWQMFQDAIPGGKDYIVNSLEHATKIATVGTILGGVAGALGAGRFRGSTGLFPGFSASKGSYPYWGAEFARNMPKYAEGVNAAMRTGPNSLWQQFTNDSKSQNPIMAPVMNKLSTNPNAFTRAEIDRLGRGIREGKLRDTIDKMLQDDNFAQRMGY